MVQPQRQIHWQALNFKMFQVASLQLVVLGVIVSSVEGQTPTRLSFYGVTVTADTIPITDVGRGGSISEAALACHTFNSATAQWLFPNGDVVPFGVGINNVPNTIHSLVQANVISLNRGRGYITQTGLYCCGQATATSNSQRLCITLAGLMIGTINVNHGSTIPITNVGSGGAGGLGDAGLTCYTSDTSTAVWLYPGGSVVPLGTSSPAADNTIHFSRQPTESTTTLHRGDGYISPGGQYCCGSPTVAIDRLCITLSSCPLLSLSNGVITYTDPDINSVTATHTCETGYQMLGGPTRTCVILAGATWGGGVVSCRAICLDLSPPMDGGITYSSMSPRLEGSTATYYCVTVGYEPSGGPVRTCQSDRSWSGGDYTCQLVDCDTPPDINGGTRTFTTTTYLSTATYSCNNGYQLSGSPTVTCSSTGDWSTTPTCRATCDDLSPPTNGAITYSTSSPRLEGATATHSCDTGYELSSVIVNPRVCMDNRVWSGAKITCTLILPTRLAIGSVNNLQGTTIPITDVGQGGGGSPALACFISEPSIAEWYFPGGSMIPMEPSLTDNTIISTRQGSAITLDRGNNVLSPGGSYCCGTSVLSINRRLCVILLAVCPSLTLPFNGLTITYNPPISPTSQGTIATYQCITGYTPNPSTRTCQSDGTWSGGETTCEPINCRTPPNIANGSPGIPNMTTLGGTVTYTCDSGYTINSDSTMATATCQTNGSWSMPICRAICDDLSPPTNGDITYSPTSSPRLEGAMAEHSCIDGYQLSSVQGRVCQSDRTWSGGEITCLVECPDLPSITNGNATYSTPSTPRLEGATATYTCAPGYQLSSDITRTCVNDGTAGVWNEMEPECLAACDDLPNITNGVITYSTALSPRLQGTTATYSCTRDLEIFNAVTRTCQNDRTWSGTEAYCQRTYLALGSTVIAGNNSAIKITSIGEDACSNEHGLRCVTDHPTCCGVSLGDWFYPNGTEVQGEITNDDFYRDRGMGFIRLNRRNNADSSLGVYCCVIPTNGGINETFCVNLVSPNLPSTQLDNTGAIVGGVVAIVLGLALILAITAIVIAYLVLKHSKESKRRDQPELPLGNKGQSAPSQTYETVDATYEDIDRTRPLKGNYDYTQNQAYAATTAPLREGGVVNTGGSGNPTGDSRLGQAEGTIYENPL